MNTFFHENSPILNQVVGLIYKDFTEIARSRYFESKKE